MSGYTPVFNTVFDGTLCGKWPDSAVWLTMLALCDKHGEVNLSFAAIGARTGWPMELLRQGIDSLMAPDLDSQSPDQEGRRLVLIDPARTWGWRIVNHLKYREKARLQSKDARRTQSGEDAERKRVERASPDVPRCPPTSPSSYSYANTDSNTDKKVPTEPVELERSTAPDEPDPAEKVFTHWQQVHRKPRARLDDKRRGIIRKALKHYSEADLCQSISGYLNSPHHMGTDPKGNGTVYDAIELFLRDSAHIDAGLKFYTEPPRTDLSGHTRRNIAATIGWIPPELRNHANK